jgi:outer membrane receptor protein involved in Fe transport
MRLATAFATYTVAAGAAMIGSSSMAQTAAPATAAANAPAADEVVVTGTRITRRDYVSDSPIVTIGVAQVAASGSVTLENTLNQLPQVSTSAGASADFATRGGQANVDLRGLGQQRTLVLIDGRRVEPSGADGTVDLNIIPTALIENVEVITGGASAIYGSDAVAGVVNLKLKQHFTGAEIDAQYGVTEHGDGATEDVTAIVGSDFVDHKGNAFIAMEYSNRGEVDFKNRSYLTGDNLTTNLQSTLVNVVSNNLPTQAAFNTVFGKYGIAPGVVPRTSQLSTNNDNTLFTEAGAYNYRGLAGPYEVLNGNVYSQGGNSFLAQTPLTRYSFVGHGTYDINNAISVFADALYTNYTVETKDNPAVAGSSTSKALSVPVTNPFIPADLQTILASRPTPGAPFTITQTEYGIGPREEKDEYNVYQLTLGVKGRLNFQDISWNAYGTYGKTQYLATEMNYPSSDAMNRLLAAPDGGASLCTGGFDPFGVHAISPSCLAYINRTARNTTTLQQQVVEFDTQGRVWQLPAGEMRFAAGIDYRENSYDFTPDALIQTGELANYAPIQPSSGSENVTEIYGELLAPVVRNLPLAQEINLDLGYRFSDYNTVGGVSTYKADFDWKVIDSVRLRGGYARATRAPSVGEIFTASSQGAVTLGAPGLIGQGDPCDIKGAYRSASSGVAAQVRALCLAQGVPANLIDSFSNTNARTPFTTAGNANLKPETSDTFSFGAVFRPKFDSPLFSKISTSIDYYNIKLDNAIGIITNSVATSQCFSSSVNASLSNSNYYCGLITRDPNTGQITTIQNPELNLGGYKTSGIDFEADWTIPLDAVGLDSKFGSITFSSVANYLANFDIQTLPGGPTLNYAGTIGNVQVDQFADAHPTWKATTSVSWQIGPVQSTIRWRYLDGMTNAADVGTGGTAHGVPAVSYFDLDGAWQVRRGLELRGGIINLADQNPPVLNDNVVGGYRTDPYTYDLVGRRFYVAIKSKF